MKNFKNLLNGIIVGILTFIYWIFIMTIGDVFRMEHPEFRDEITFAFIISSIIVNLILVYVFYSRSSIKNGKTLLFITLPYVLFLITAEIVALNIPRMLDVVFVVIGSFVIYAMTQRKLESYKPILILGTYFITISLSYTFLFNLIDSIIN